MLLLLRRRLTLLPLSPCLPRYSQLNNLLMQLRKCCNHPYLFPDAEEDPDTTPLEDLVAASGKLRLLDRLLVKLHKGNHRCVLFSQFRMQLDILTDYCALRGWRHTRLDGATNRVQRTVNVNSFNAPGSRLFVFLMTTRAGGLGINLQTADTCILYDSDWNPQADEQAMARVHRLGQKKPVHVYVTVTLTLTLTLTLLLLLLLLLLLRLRLLLLLLLLLHYYYYYYCYYYSYYYYYNYYYHYYYY